MGAFNLPTYQTWGNAPGVPTWFNSTSGSGAPTIVTPPSISGTIALDGTITFTAGTWAGADTVTSQLYRGGVAIPGATSSPYTVTMADLLSNYSLTLVETATNAKGNSTSTSNALQNISTYAGVSGLVASWEFNKGYARQTFNSNDVCGYLLDLTGNGYNMSQRQLTFNPLYDAANGITFGPNMFMQLYETNALLSNVSGFTVLYHGTVNVGAANKTCFAVGRVGGSTPRLMNLVFAGTSSNKMRFRGKPNATTGSDASVLSTSGVTLASLKKFVWVVDIVNNTVSFYVDGAANGEGISLGLTTPPTVTPTGDPNTVVMGGNSSITTDGSVIEPLSFDLTNKSYMKGLHVFNRALSGAEVAAL